jgi:hypothetical protein
MIPILLSPKKEEAVVVMVKNLKLFSKQPISALQIPNG